jgi:REP element-mobilizing transposase RayT
MSNHIHLLLEIVPAASEGISDGELLRRLRAINSEAQVAEVAGELEEARKAVAAGRADESLVKAIHARFTYRMHDLSQFMKSFMQRYTQWHNGRHRRKGRLWEDRFKSVIVESGIAARTMAAYIDLNPVRAGMVADPAEYRWSSYGEAVGGGNKGNGKKAREGLVRACMSHHGAGFEAEKWKEVSRVYRRAMGLALGRKSGKAEVDRKKVKPGLNTEEALAAKDNGTVLPDLGMAAMLMHRVRYFTDGAVIGSKEFVNEAFAGARERFGLKRRTGARSPRGCAAPARGVLWTARDLRVGV